MFREIVRYWYETRWTQKTVDAIVVISLVGLIFGLLVGTAVFNPLYDVR